MQSLITYFFKLCTLRESPADAPLSNGVLQGAVVLFTVSNVLQAVGFQPMVVLVVIAICKTVVMFVLLRMVLRMNNKLERLPQTATAWFGAVALLQCISLPFMLQFAEKFQAVQASGDLSQLPPSLALILFGLAIWTVVVMAHILKHAIGTTTGKSVILSIGLWLIMEFVATSLAWLVLSVFGIAPVTPGVDA